ncbi:MAG: delta-60 repeat domain-containing protein, partial [Desulfosudaceae bacterium]
DLDVAVARFDDAGYLDSTFNSSGYLIVDVLGQYDAGRAVAIQEDGAIVVAGYGGGNTESDFLAMRFTSTGAADTSFGGDGQVLTDISGLETDFGYDLAIQDDGRIVVAGTHATPSEVIGALVRYNADGSLDTGFGGSGIVTTNFGGTGTVDDFFGLTLQSDGKAVVAGRSNNDFLTARYEMFSSANSPPDTPTHVSPEPFALIAPGQPVTLEASAFSDPDGDSHVSSYWRVTRADIDHFSSTVGPFNHETTTDLTSYTIADASFTEGLAYYWKVGYMDSGSGQYSWTEEPTELEVPPDIFVIGTQETSTSPPVPPGETAAAYQMVSAHHIPADPRPAVVIGDDLAGGYDSTQYRLGVYDCEQGAYQEYPDFMVYPGGAMWVLAREGLSIDITGVPVATGVDVETTLRYNNAADNGWNMVGPPNDRNYLWSHIEVVEYDPNTGQVLFSEPIGFLAADNPYIDTRLWEWDNGQYYTTSTMEAGAGYWVRARRPNINLRFTVGAQVAWNNPGVMLAAAGQQVKHLAGAVLGGSEAVAAEEDDTPPAPMAALNTSDRDDSSVDVTCFISTLEE